MTNTPHTALVTGVSSGIGRAIAQALIDKGWRVFGSVRKESDAEAVAEALGPGFEPLLFDVTDPKAIQQSADIVDAALEGRTLSALVNNAGIAVYGPLRYLSIDDIERQLNINLYGAIRVTQAYLGMLGADKDRIGDPGRIVNMSSLAGRIASPFMGPYSMSKHALEAFSDTLRREMRSHGVDVITVGPGSVSTPIWAKADEVDLSRFENTEYGDNLKKMKGIMQEFGKDGLPPEDIGALVYDILTIKKPRTRYAILKQKFMLWTLPNLLPKRWVDAALTKRFGIE